jgi:hypothetical protein
LSEAGIAIKSYKIRVLERNYSPINSKSKKRAIIPAFLREFIAYSNL